ncbi:MAG: cyclase family protein [Dissulfuribacterales bacterium]
MAKWIYLSYPINSQTPAYGGSEGFILAHDKVMEKGDSCNTSQWSLSNHLGTYIDFPKHFVRGGKCLTDYPADFWAFTAPAILGIASVEPSSIIQPQELDIDSISRDVDLLLVKTGFCDYRSQEIYWRQNPGFAPGVATVLRDKLPRLRVFAFDSISLSSFAHREIGRQAHRAFLNNLRPILLLEDVDLTGIDVDTILQEVVIAPFRVEGAGGAPCTVIGKMS